MLYLVQAVGREYGMVGGSWTFTEELARCTGGQVVRISNKHFEEETYGNGSKLLSLDLYDFFDLVKRQPGRVIVTVTGPKHGIQVKRLVEELDAEIVVHDGRFWDDIPMMKPDTFRAIVIRRRNAQWFNTCSYLMHPYTRKAKHVPLETRPHLAVCHARLDFNKRQHEIWRSGIDCVIRGRPNRAYVKWQMDGFVAVPFDNAIEVCQLGKLNIDLTKMPMGDGGGTQYTWLEAMDAGSIPVCHDDWGKCEFEHLSVNKDTLKDLRVPDNAEEIVERNWKYLLQHSGNVLERMETCKS